MLVPPVYARCVNFNKAAAECIIGIETLLKTLPIIIASFNVQSFSARGSRNPLKKAAGLYSAFLTAQYRW